MDILSKCLWNYYQAKSFTSFNSRGLYSYFYKQAYAQTLDKMWREVTFHIVRPWSGFKKWEKRELNEFYPKIILAKLA